MTQKTVRYLRRYSPTLRRERPSPSSGRVGFVMKKLALVYDFLHLGLEIQTYISQCHISFLLSV
jgi:hypothetical protein